MSEVKVLNPHNEFLSLQKPLYFPIDIPLITPKYLIQSIRDNGNIWIFDLRSFENYSTSHVMNAKHWNCSTNLMTKKSVLNLKREINSSGNTSISIIMYNQDNNKYNDCLLDFIGNIKLNIKFLQGGFEEFLKVSPDEFIEYGKKNIVCSPTNRSIVSDDIMAADMNKIEDHLYLGNANDSENLTLLAEEGITGILCVASGAKLHFAELNLFEYKRIEADDSCNQNLLKYFDESYDFIEKFRINNGKVLVHCKAGVSRSVTITMAYLIKRYKMAVLDALNLVTSKRSIASPNLNFLGQLERYYNEQKS